jgi:hypothetical protein
LIYLDSSVLLSRVFSEQRCPPDDFWKLPFVSSRLLQFEVFTRINALGFTASHSEAARGIIGRGTLLELSVTNLARALEPFPVPVRTLDSLHLATMVFLRANGQTLTLASYDIRLIAAAQALGFPLAEI